MGREASLPTSGLLGGIHVQTLLQLNQGSGRPRALFPGRSGRRLRFSFGQLGLDPATNDLVPGGIQAETRRALRNIADILKELDLTMASIVKAMVFLRDMSDFSTVNSIYAEAFGSAFPARSAVQVAALPKGAAIEIEVIAAIDKN